MQKKMLILIVIFLLVGIFSAHSEIKYSAQVDSEVYSELNEKSEVKVIVKLKKPKYSISSDQAIKSYVLNSMSDSDFKKKRDYTLINGFAGSVNEKGLDKLLKNPNVEKVYFDGVHFPNAVVTLEEINATITHPIQVSGKNITGEGQTVCVLDTGINYSHESFGGCSEDQFLNGTCIKVPGGWDYIDDDNE